MSGVVYARVPDSLKQALHKHAADRGLTLTGAVVEVAERGLEAIRTGASLESLADRLAALNREVERARMRLKEAEIRLQTAREREETIARAYAGVAERMRQELARCPGCRKPVGGADLLMRGHCPYCGRALTSLLAPTRAGIDRDEWIALLGALGVLAGLATATVADDVGDQDNRPRVIRRRRKPPKQARNRRSEAARSNPE